MNEEAINRIWKSTIGWGADGKDDSAFIINPVDSKLMGKPIMATREKMKESVKKNLSPESQKNVYYVNITYGMFESILRAGVGLWLEAEVFKTVEDYARQMAENGGTVLVMGPEIKSAAGMVYVKMFHVGSPNKN